MRRTIIPFTTDDIIIITPDGVSDSYWNTIKSEINSQISILLEELHPLSPKSPLYRLNNSGVGFPIQLTSLLYRAIAELSNYQEDLIIEAGLLPIADSFIVDEQELTVTRTREKVLPVNLIFKELAIEVIDEVLVRSKISDYLIRCRDTYLCEGSSDWELKFYHPSTEEEIFFNAQRGAIAMSYPKFKTGQNLNTPFAHHNSWSDSISAILVEANTPIKTKAIIHAIQKLEADYQVEQLASTRKIGTTLLYKDGSYKQFKSS